tara:strand:- start:124 stop:786 length:663 start_codon:yes stop_codon:yes gene_type:complete
MDLSTIEGLNLTPEQQASIMTAHETSINAATTGLVNKNNELLGEKKTAMQNVTEQSEALEQARQVATKAEEERLKLAGDVEGLKSHYESQLAEATAKANAEAEKANAALLSRDKGSALNDALSLIHPDFKGLAKAELSNMLKISYNDQQQPVTTFEYEGKVVANNVEEFKGWAGEQSTFKRILNGVDSSGANTQQSSTTSGGKMTLTEQAIAANKAARQN